MERGLLSDPQLAKHYDGVVWMYLFQDFSHSDADRAAERLAIRFGISSWPQHFLVDPFTLAKMADTGRSLDAFRAAVARAPVNGGTPSPSAPELAAADTLAASLEKGGDVKLAKQHLRHADRVVAFRALQIVVKKAPQDLVAESSWLLAVPNDQIRGQVCDVLAEHGDVEARDALHGIVRDPGQSENPNVLRMRAVKALGRCGDGSSLQVVQPFAVSGAWRNGLTSTAVQTVAAIGERVKKSKADAVAILAQAYPPVPAGENAASEQRMCEALAKNVHDALQKLAGRKVPFPGEYDDAARKKLMASW
ncbi:MAG: HEAT repeat domain-containing protein [Planctomycetota bacterium]